MNVKVNEMNGRYVVVMDGRVDVSDSDMFGKAIAPLMSMKNVNVEIDCSCLDYTSSQGLKLFLQLRDAVTSTGGSLVFTNMQPQVKEIFDLSGFSKVMDIE